MYDVWIVLLFFFVALVVFEACVVRHARPSAHWGYPDKFTSVYRLSGWLSLFFVSLVLVWSVIVVSALVRVGGSRSIVSVLFRTLFRRGMCFSFIILVRSFRSIPIVFRFRTLLLVILF